MKKLKLEDKLFLLICILILTGGLLKPFIKPIYINPMENRTAYNIPIFSINTFLDKSYQDSMEKAFSDQIPLANQMKTFVNTGITKSKKIFYKTLNSNNYYNLLDGIYLYNDYLAYGQTPFIYRQSGLDARAMNINQYVKDLPDVNFNLYYIERDVDIDFKSNSKINAYAYLLQHLDRNVKTQKFEINNFDEFKQYFYKTDHHWNYRGSYKAYQELVSMLTNDESVPYQREICFPNAMSGSKSAAIGGVKVFRENFCGYQFDLPEHDIYINNELINSYGNYSEIIKNGSKSISYGDFYGNDFGLIEFDYHQLEKDNLLIIGESYDNAINELLAKHFNKTYNVDLRHYRNSIGKEFNLFEFLKENQIKKILLIGNIEFFTNDIFALKGEE